MPIPGLSAKTYSPQDWRKKTIGHGNARHTPPIHSGAPRRKKRLSPEMIKRIGTLALIVVGIGAVTSIILLASVARSLPNPNKIIDRTIALSTKIYDRTGEHVIYDIHGDEKRTLVKLADIPNYLKQATLVIEDKKFYEHKGIRLTSIIRSAIADILTGSKAQGGSTLTQQLVKNAILSPEKTYTRKIKEIILAYQIEKKFTKDEILQLYFNEIPYGSTAYGVEAASQTYFGKGIKDVSLAEAAVLAALPNAPTYYSPYGTHVDQLLARQRLILKEMANAGYITAADATNAGQEKIEFKKRTESITAPHFVLYIKDYLTQKYGDLAVEQGGLKVITTLDLYKQEKAEQAIASVAEKNAKQWNANNEALVALDPKTGQILAMVGSRDYFADPQPEGCDPGKNCVFDPQVNIVTRPRQPGSSFKPIVYAAAFKKGYTPDTVLYDVVTRFINYNGQDYEPHNYNLKEYGPVTMRQALAGSLNVPAVKTIYLTGVDNVINLAEDLGYTTLEDRSRFGLSLVLGGAEVKLLEHTNAFAVFAREGEWHPPVAILKVEDKDGNILEEYKPEERKVMETEVARKVNSILTDNNARAFIFGGQNSLTLGGRPVGAKTGTTNDYHDAWTVGYTPSLVAGVWVGNSNNQEMKRGADGSIVAAPIWHAFMQSVLGNTPSEAFQAPAPNTSDKPVLNGQLASGGLKVKVDKISGKLATDLTPPNLVEEKTFNQLHDILYYINKNDPQGTTPPNLNDSQYKRWEEAVQRWATDNKITSEEPPTEFDDIHVTANQPSITIVWPTANQQITDRHLIAAVSALAPRGINRVEYFLNNQPIFTAHTAPFGLDAQLTDPALNDGLYTLKAVAFDDVDNSQSATVDLNLQLPPQ